MKFEAAKGAYRRVLERDPNHAKVLQQLGWLHHQQSTNYASQEQAIEYLEKSVASGKPCYSMIMCVELITCSDQTDAQSWYLLGRCYMSQQKYPKAYEAYQQAVYRDGRNPTFWCSIGVLYYQINQYRDALDAYSRAIRLNPNISEVWYDLGTLVSTCRSLTTSASLTMSQYESCNNQTADALDAYQRAADLDPSNVHIKARLQLLQNGQSSAGGPNQGNAPIPQDVHPQAYQPANVHGPAAPQWGAPQSSQPPQGPVPPALAPGWDRPLAQIRDPGLPPQQLNPYEQRDGIRPPTQHVPQRPVSPRQEPSRSYAEPSRPPTNGPGPQGPAGPPPPGPGPMRRGMSPSPKTHHVAPSPYHPQAPHLTSNSSLLSQPVFRTRTTVLMLGVSLHHRHLRRQVLVVQQVRFRVRVRCYLTVVLPAHPRRCARLLRTDLDLHATDTRARTSTIPTLLLIAALRMVLLHRLLLLLLPSRLPEIVTIDRQLHHRSATVSGRTATI
jgi:glucose repression mediator protein